MIRSILKLGAVFAAMCLWLGCVSEPKRTQVEPEWFGKMHKLSEAHRYLMPMAVDAKRFNDPAEKPKIEQYFKLLVETSAEVAGDPKQPNSDPLIEFTARSFANDMRQAYSAYKASDVQWARMALARSGDYCVACHTRADRGTKDFPISWKPQILALAPSQAIDFFLANRQYGRAMDEAHQLAIDPKMASQDSLTWLSSMRKIFTMLVRVQGDRAKASELVHLSLRNGGVPFFIRADLRQWLQDIEAWQRETPIHSDKEKLRLAEKLLAGGQITQPHDSQGPFISFLRASKLLHELLEKSTASFYPEALYYSGLASELLSEANLGQYYYETCIRTLPHSVQAERCFHEYYTSVRASNPYLDYEPQLEYSIRMHMDEMRRLAEAVDLDSQRVPRMDIMESPGGR